MYQPVKTTAIPANLFSRKDLITTTVISIVYLLLSKLVVGFRTDELVLVAVFNLLYYVSFPTRRLIKGFSIFIVYWIVFDYMKAFPNYLYNTVHIQSLYHAEQQLFGFPSLGRMVTPNEYFRLHANAVLDVMSGCFYLCWVPVPLAFAAWLFFKRRDQFLQFALTFFLVNLIGFVIYYLYPAAAPWYVQQYGFQFHANTPGNTAGLQRFDDFFHTPVFHSIYAKSSNVFAAMPSLHSSYPVIVLFYGIKNRLGWINIVFGTIMAGIWFAAVYTSHHYVLDVLAGILCALAGITIFQKFILPSKMYHWLVQQLIS